MEGSPNANHDTFFRGSMMNLDIVHDFFMAHLGSELLQRIEPTSLKLESSTFIDEVHKELSLK